MGVVLLDGVALLFDQVVIDRLDIGEVAAGVGGPVGRPVPGLGQRGDRAELVEQHPALGVGLVEGEVHLVLGDLAVVDAVVREVARHVLAVPGALDLHQVDPEQHVVRAQGLAVGPLPRLDGDGGGQPVGAPLRLLADAQLVVHLGLSAVAEVVQRAVHQRLELDDVAGAHPLRRGEREDHRRRESRGAGPGDDAALLRLAADLGQPGRIGQLRGHASSEPWWCAGALPAGTSSSMADTPRLPAAP